MSKKDIVKVFVFLVNTQANVVIAEQKKTEQFADNLMYNVKVGWREEKRSKASKILKTTKGKSVAFFER